MGKIFFGVFFAILAAFYIISIILKQAAKLKKNGIEEKQSPKMQDKKDEDQDKIDYDVNK